MSSTPDLILFNGTIHTLDPDTSFATAVAICGKHIQAVADDRKILALAGPDTRKIDLEKKLVLPGFTDTHFHFYEWVLNVDSIDFSTVFSFKDMEKSIRERAKTLEPGSWILGQGFNESDWPENKMPLRYDLDRVAPHHPVCIWRCDLHLAVANSMALERAGIDRHTPDPPDGVIERDASGNPTGVLKELAPNLVREVLPELSETALLANMETCITQAHALGLTGVHDIRLMGGKEGATALHAWQTLNTQGKLRLRCHVSLPGEMTTQAVALGLHTGFGDELLQIGHLKFFADGGMGARTAWVTEKYLDADYGMALTPVDEIEAAVTLADSAGLSCMVHAVGDRACHEIIAMYARVEARGESRCNIPHRMEHVQMILPEDLKGLATLKNLAVSCQPANLSLDISMIDQCAGDRGRYAYTLKNILNTGVPMMLSSDAPVADPNPFAGIYAAVNRKRMDKTPRQGWYMDQALDVAEAVKGYTLTPARASGCGHILGSISPGKLADMVVTDRNIFEILSEEIIDTTVVMTLFNGQVVHG
ncbi:MAG: amidohydrolase [Desulfobacterium sp.]